jgi:hypothetical protein
VSVEEEVEAQQALADSLSAGAPRGWTRVFVNFEVMKTPEGTFPSVVAFTVDRSLFGKITRREMWLSDEQYKLFNAVVNSLMKRANVEALTIDALVRHDGRFRFYVDYGPPTRLGGDIAASGRYLKYVDDDPVLSSLAKVEARK